MAFGGGRFLGVSGGPGHPQFHASGNGVDWTLVETSDGDFFTPFFTAESLAYLNGHFVMGTSDMGVLFLDEDDRWTFGGGPNRAAALAFSGNMYIATSLWTYRLPEPEPPLTPPTLAWEIIGDLLRLRFPAHLDHRYRLWERPGLGGQSSWVEVQNLTALNADEQFEVTLRSQTDQLWLYRISVEPPEAGF